MRGQRWKKTVWMGTGAALLSASALAMSVAKPERPKELDQRAWSCAEVVKIQPEEGKIQLRHGELDWGGPEPMPAMRMVFKIAEPWKLGAIKAGDAVRFKASKAEQGYLAWEIEPGWEGCEPSAKPGSRASP